MFCVVVILPDTSVAVIHPNYRKWNAAIESQEAFATRIAAKSQSRDARLAGLPAFIIPIASLPARKITDPVSGTVVSARDAWRKAPGRNEVIVDMPSFVVTEHVLKARRDAEIDVELAKPNPDLVKVARLQREEQKRRESK